MNIARFIFASCLAPFRPGHDYRPALDQYASLGFNGVRAFCGPLPWCGQERQHVYDQLPTFLREANDRGLGVEPAVLTETRSGYDVDEHCARIRDGIGDAKHVVVEGANEYTHPTQNLSQQQLIDLGRRYFSHLPYAIGAPAEDEPSNPNNPPVTWGGTGANYGTAHLDRGRDFWNEVRRVREIEACSAHGRFPLLNNEPKGAAEPGTPGQRRWNPEWFYTLGALNRLFEIGGVFHSQSGLWADVLGPVQTECAKAFVAGSTVWPDDPVRLQYFNVGHTGSPCVSAHFNEGQTTDGITPKPGVTRAYCGVRDGRGFMVAVGLGGDYRQQVQFGNGWAPQETLGKMNGVEVVRLAA
jgi:hypothetical protein